MDGPSALTIASSILRGSGENEAGQGQTGESQTRKTYKDLDLPGKKRRQQPLIHKNGISVVVAQCIHRLN